MAFNQLDIFNDGLSSKLDATIGVADYKSELRMFLHIFIIRLKEQVKYKRSYYGAAINNPLSFVDYVLDNLLDYYYDCSCLSARKDSRKMGMVVINSPYKKVMMLVIHMEWAAVYYF